MPQVSAGMLMYRRRQGRLEVLLIHPGGPFWRRRDQGSWMIPKGKLEAGEDPLTAAKREFQEETGLKPGLSLTPLGAIRQKGGKIVHAWAFEGDADPAAIKSNTFELEYPPKSGRFITVPEVDRAAFYDLAQAREKILPSQLPLLEALAKLVAD